MRRGWFRRTGWRHLVGIVVVVLVLFPVVYVVGAAFSATGDLTRLLPSKLSLQNFETLWSTPRYPYWAWFRNSLVVCLGSATLSVLLGALSAYAFSRLRFKGRDLGMATLLLFQIFPGMLLVVALFLIMVQLEDLVPAIGLGTHAGLILVYLGTSLGGNIWLLKGFFDSIPKELDESALVDGASHTQIFVLILLPLARPMLAVAALLSTIAALNDFVLASALLSGAERWTLAVGLYQFVNAQYSQFWGPFAAGALIAATPVVVMFLVLQKAIVSGLTQGSLKG